MTALESETPGDIDLSSDHSTEHPDDWGGQSGERPFGIPVPRIPLHLFSWLTMAAAVAVAPTVAVAVAQ